MLKQPEHFDTNEWFVIIAVSISYALILFLPKRFPLSISPAGPSIQMAYAQVIDHILTGTSYDLYDFNDVGNYEWFDLPQYFENFITLLYFYQNFF